MWPFLRELAQPAGSQLATDPQKIDKKEVLSGYKTDFKNQEARDYYRFNSFLFEMGLYAAPTTAAHGSLPAVRLSNVVNISHVQVIVSPGGEPRVSAAFCCFEIFSSLCHDAVGRQEQPIWPYLAQRSRCREKSPVS